MPISLSNAGTMPSSYSPRRRYRRAAVVSLRTSSGWAANQNIAQSMTSNAASATATEQSQVVAPRAAGLASSTAIQAKLASHSSVAAAVIAAAGAGKVAARSLGGTLVTPATILQKSVSKSIAAVISGSLTGIAKLIGKLLTAGVVASIAAWLKSRVAILLATSSSSSTIARGIFKRLNASGVSAAAAVFSGKLYARALASALVQATAGGARRSLRVLVAQGGSVVGVGRAVAHGLATHTTGGAAILRGLSRRLAVTVGSPAAIGKSAKKFLATGSSFIGQITTTFLKWKMNPALRLSFDAPSLGGVLTLAAVLDPLVRLNDVVWLKVAVLGDALLDLAIGVSEVALDRNLVFGATLG